MDSYSKYFTIVVTTSTIFFLSCDFKKVSYNDLKGNWTILSAERNGKLTQTLDNVYFKFDQQPKMTTNIFGSENTFDIDYKYPEILIQSSKLDILNVKTLSGDTLSIMTRIHNYRYDFLLLKD